MFSLLGSFAVISFLWKFRNYSLNRWQYVEEAIFIYLAY